MQEPTKNRLNDALLEILKWIKETFPTALVMSGAVYSWMLQKLKKEESAHEKTKLEKELVENELRVEHSFDGMSDADIIKSKSTNEPPS